MNEMYLKRRDMKLCVQCGANDERTEAGKTLCARCAGMKRDNRRFKVEMYRRRGWCTNCGKRPDQDQSLLEHKMCTVCRERYNKAHAKMRTEARAWRNANGPME